MELANYVFKCFLSGCCRLVLYTDITEKSFFTISPRSAVKSVVAQRVFTKQSLNGYCQYEIPVWVSERNTAG